MKYAVNSEEMKKIDDYTVQVLKIPALDLMERAANELVNVMKSRISKADRILAVCGPGNNGGDGVAAGRILFLQGYHVAILFIGDVNKVSASMKIQLDMAGKLGIHFENSNKLREYNIIIDAVFGVGLTRDVAGDYETIVNEINGNDNIIFAVDIPSGISADNGKVMKTAVMADYTVTFGHMKKGLLMYPGTEYAGEITVADIGFPEEATVQTKPDTFYYETEDLCRLPERKNYSNKGTFGKVLIIAGSKGMSGAAYLSAKAAYRTGAGLVKVVTSKDNRIILQSSLPEALFSAYDAEEYTPREQKEKLLSELNWATVVVIGPGLGRTDKARDLLETVIANADVPLIIDADAINLLAEKLDGIRSGISSDKVGQDVSIADLSVSKRLAYLSEAFHTQVIITPHLMELSRLMGIPMPEIADNLIDTAKQCSYNNKLIYAIKDARTIVAKEGSAYINVSGNNGMATGGSGDVLTGILSALIAQGMESYEAACLAVYIHGLAGDEAAKEKGTYSMMAGDIVDSIEKVLKRKR